MAQFDMRRLAGIKCVGTSLPMDIFEGMVIDLIT